MPDIKSSGGKLFRMYSLVEATYLKLWLSKISYALSVRAAPSPHALIPQQEFELALSKPISPSSAPPWQPPPMDWYKINFDAAISTEFVVAAAVCHDCEGNILNIETKIFTPSSALVGECQAL
ncbi:hypothetical protein PanWU01x14_297580 [Parasponia andersonii]|uniref:RNase H type-1 domain-containing protein n=1 Tax=Parasponia andersonii TaxID=3476 RepID=A0A2P5AVA8_PARAD|nr:hypothetical protein PanWU01x14_297580 [Parasponia andersonii]